jgi:hypothetical protein
MRYTKESAAREREKMMGWNNPRVVVDPDLAADGSEVVYILAEDPANGRTVIWDSPEQVYARYL